MNPIATAELRLLLRNRVVTGCAFLIPLAFGILYSVTRDSAPSSGTVAGLITVTMIAMGTYVTATTTLAARRQTLYLKRLRGGAVTDRAIITGLLAPVVMVSVAQVAVILTYLATAGTTPENPALLIVAILLAEAMFGGLAFATAGFSNSPEHAQYTTFPIFAIAMGAAIWYQATGTDNLIAVKRALPGGALAELVTSAWNGGSLANVALLLAICAAWTLAGILAARAFFRWEPRR